MDAVSLLNFDGECVGVCILFGSALHVPAGALGIQIGNAPRLFATPAGVSPGALSYSRHCQTLSSASRRVPRMSAQLERRRASLSFASARYSRLTCPASASLSPTGEQLPWLYAATHRPRRIRVLS